MNFNIKLSDTEITSLVNFIEHWNVVARSLQDDEQDSEQIEINFNTAWSPPEAICRKLRDMFPDLSVSWFFDEPGMEVAGYL